MSTPEMITVARVGGLVFQCDKRDPRGREIALRNFKPIGDLTPDGYRSGGWAYRFQERPMPRPRFVRDRTEGREWLAAEDRL